MRVRSRAVTGGACVEERVKRDGARAAARNMAGLADCGAHACAARAEDRAAGCLAVLVCGLGIAVSVLACLLLAGPCRRETRPGPQSLAANIAAGRYGDELADSVGESNGIYWVGRPCLDGVGRLAETTGERQ